MLAVVVSGAIARATRIALPLVQIGLGALIVLITGHTIDLEPDVFFLPRPSELRFNWVESRLAALEHDRMRELVLDAWCMVVPKKLWPMAGR